MKLASHPLFTTLRELKGNPRIIVLTEPLFGIPYNLFMPFFSVFMLAIGLSDQQIGSIASLGLVLQVFTAMVSGAIVDKFGRRFTLFICDIIGWTIPCLIWALAVDIRYFIAAAFLNSAWRISHTAWTCLMVEDAEERHLVHIWTWIMIFGVCSAFFSPIGGWLVNRFGLVPVTRGLFLFGSGMIGFKAVYLYIMSHETARGKQRLVETKKTSLFGLMAEYGSVFPRVFASKPIMLALSLMIVTNIYNTVSGSFWGVLFTSKLGFVDSEISIYIALRSIFMTVCFFLLGSRFTNISRYKLPLWLGFGAFFSSQAILIWMPPHSIPLVVTSVLLEGIASAFVSPMTESLLSLSLESNDRARVSAVVYLILIVVSSPFGWIAGQLSAIDRSLPFALNMGLFLVGALVVTFFKNSVTGKDKQLLV